MSENQKLKIAYIELDTHPDILSNFYELMRDSEVFEVSYFLSEKISRIFNVQDSAIRIVDVKNVVQVLQQESWDLVVIGTVHRYFNVFSKIVKQFPTAIIVHNLEFSKSSKQNLTSSIVKEDTLYRLKLATKEGLFSMNSVYENAKTLFVLDQKFENSKYEFLPLFYVKSTENQSSDVFKVVIPGAVSQKRRDYKRILKQVLNFKKPTELVLLGKAQGYELKWILETKKQLPNHIHLSYFTEKVPQEHYDSILISGNVLWCPIQIETEFFSQKEWYGKTKLSGNIGDAIKFAKPAVFPKEYQSDFPFIFSEESDVETQLHDVSNSKIDWNSFSKEKVQKELEETLLKAIKI